MLNWRKSEINLLLKCEITSKSKMARRLSACWLGTSGWRCGSVCRLQCSRHPPLGESDFGPIRDVCGARLHDDTATGSCFDMPLEDNIMEDLWNKMGWQKRCENGQKVHKQKRITPKKQVMDLTQAKVFDKANNDKTNTSWQCPTIRWACWSCSTHPRGLVRSSEGLMTPEMNSMTIAPDSFQSCTAKCWMSM